MQRSDVLFIVFVLKKKYCKPLAIITTLQIDPPENKNAKSKYVSHRVDIQEIKSSDFRTTMWIEFIRIFPQEI